MSLGDGVEPSALMGPASFVWIRSLMFVTEASERFTPGKLWASAPNDSSVSAQLTMLTSPALTAFASLWSSGVAVDIMTRCSRFSTANFTAAARRSFAVTAGFGWRMVLLLTLQLRRMADVMLASCGVRTLRRGHDLRRSAAAARSTCSANGHRVSVTLRLQLW